MSEYFPLLLVLCGGLLSWGISKEEKKKPMPAGQRKALLWLTFLMYSVGGVMCLLIFVFRITNRY